MHYGKIMHCNTAMLQKLENPPEIMDKYSVYPRYRIWVQCCISQSSLYDFPLEMNVVQNLYIGCC